MALPFTSGDRILVHLLHRGSAAEPASNFSDQETIAHECAIGRTHVPRALSPLIAEGMVTESVGRSPGKQRRVKVYRLTADGVDAASKVLERAREERLSWTGPDGSISEERLLDAARRLNDDLTALKRPPLPLSVILSMTGELRWNELMWLSASMGTASVKGYCLPKGFSIRAPPQHTDRVVGRAAELGVLERMLKEDRLAVVTGASGIGKRTLVLGHADIRGLKVLWLTRGGSEELCLGEDSYDLLVLEGPADMDLSDLLRSGGELEVNDPRGEGWPEQLRNIPLVILVDGNVRVKGRALELKGIESKVFVNGCAGSGLPERISKALHSACGGSPSALAYVKCLKSDDIRSLTEMETDDAVLRLLIGLNRSDEHQVPNVPSKD